MHAGDDINIISGIGDSKKCRQRSNHLTACFTFYLPNEMQFVDVTSAQLWFYKEYGENDGRNQTFVLSELDHWDLYGNFEKNVIMAIFETDIRGGSRIEIKVFFPLSSSHFRRISRQTLLLRLPSPRNEIISRGNSNFAVFSNRSS